MKSLITLSLFFLITNEVYAQKVEPWVSFYNSDSTLVGYRDTNNKVQIPPKFDPFYAKGSFLNIIAVTEKTGEKSYDYYLTKSGKKVGRDSVYYWDFTPDYEQEGFIRFHDRHTDKMGLLDSQGNVVIPAVYDYLSKVHNGTLHTLFGATKHTDEEHEHQPYVGGKSNLIDTNNQVLLDTFDLEGYPNFYSLQIRDTPDPSPIRHSFKSNQGGYYF